MEQESIKSDIIKDIAKDFAKFKNRVMALLVYGSYATKEETPRSDIDICIVAGNKEKAKQLYRETLAIQGKKPEYDIHIFELLPLYLKYEVIKSSKVVLAKNLPELYYYFYFFRKLWQDQAINRIEIRG
jgi:hypothetical protein